MTPVPALRRRAMVFVFALGSVLVAAVLVRGVANPSAVQLAGPYDYQTYDSYDPFGVNPDPISSFDRIPDPRNRMSPIPWPPAQPRGAQSSHVVFPAFRAPDPFLDPQPSDLFGDSYYRPLPSMKRYTPQKRVQHRRHRHHDDDDDD